MDERANKVYGRRLNWRLLDQLLSAYGSTYFTYREAVVTYCATRETKHRKPMNVGDYLRSSVNVDILENPLRGVYRITRDGRKWIQKGAWEQWRTRERATNVVGQKTE
jgi:hypothetical protein